MGQGGLGKCAVADVTWEGGAWFGCCGAESGSGSRHGFASGGLPLEAAWCRTANRNHRHPAVRPGPVHREAWLTVASISHKWSRQVGALVNETQARSQSCWAKSKNKFLPDIKSNQEPLACCPSPACLPSFPCAVSCAVTPDLASLAQLFPSPNHRSPSDWTTRCSGSSVSSTAALILKTTVQQHTHTHTTPATWGRVYHGCPASCGRRRRFAF